MLRFATALVLAPLICSIQSAVHATSTACIAVPNGDFDQGTKGWTFLENTSQSGEAASGLSATIADGTDLFDPLDSLALRLDAFVFTGSTEPQFDFGDASAEIVASRISQLAGRYLGVRIGGGFDWSNFGGASITMYASIRVRPAPTLAGEPEIVHVIRDSHQPVFDGCSFDISVFGIFGNEPAVIIDLFEQDGKPTGLAVGDFVTIEAVVRVASSAVGECQGSDVFISLFVDEFQFCDQLPGSGAPGDVTGDGMVDVDDLLAVINYWGFCPVAGGTDVGGAVGIGCNTADIAPPGPPQGDGEVNVDDLLMVINNWSS